MGVRLSLRQGSRWQFLGTLGIKPRVWYPVPTPFLFWDSVGLTLGGVPESMPSVMAEKGV